MSTQWQILHSEVFNMIFVRLIPHGLQINGKLVFFVNYFLGFYNSVEVFFLSLDFVKSCRCIFTVQPFTWHHMMFFVEVWMICVFSTCRLIRNR